MLFLVLVFLSFATFALSEEPHHTTAFIGYANQIDILPSFSHYSTDSFWNRHGKKLPTFNRFKRNSYLLYAEYAANPSNSLTLHAGYSTVTESMNGNSRGLEDVELGWKYLLYGNSKSALTGQIIAIIPTGDKKSSIRYGKPGAQANILYSHIFLLLNRCGWYDLELGYRYYHGFPSDQLRASAAIGYEIGSYFDVIASSRLDYGIGNGKPEFNFNNVVFHPNYRLAEIQLEGVIKIISQLSISLGAYMHVWGQNVGAGGGCFCGLWLDF